MVRQHRRLELRVVSVQTPASGSPPRRSHVPSGASPRVPPRPSASTDSLRSSAPTPMLPPRPGQAGLASPALTSSTLTIGTRRAAPPVPGRSPSSTSISSLIVPSSAKRAPPPVPASRSRADSMRPASPLQSSSPILTPASTGDYMLVTSATAPKPTSTSKPAPPLPPRSNDTVKSTPQAPPVATKPPALIPPQPRPSLDMNGSPPEGLVSPVSPDPLGVNGLLKSGRKAPPPIVKPKPVSGTVVGEDEKKAAPVVPRKPVALRSVSGTGNS